MLRHLLLLLAVTLVTCRPDKLPGGHGDHGDHGDHHEHHDEQHHHHEEKKAEEPKAKASDVNDGGRLLSLPEADACANRQSNRVACQSSVIQPFSFSYYKDRNTGS